MMGTVVVVVVFVSSVCSKIRLCRCLFFLFLQSSGGLSSEWAKGNRCSFFFVPPPSISLSLSLACKRKNPIKD
uniref:Putative secreted protein n=1 Tax=Anopheles marajoara TaxID=58244 RepID=A0A2M4CDY6_9DIPT